MPRKSSTSPLHVRLMDGLNVHSRPNGAVHSIHGGPDGKTVAEVCVGSGKPSGTVRLNFRAKPPAKAVPKGVTLDGRSQSWAGGGIRVTESNLAACRALLVAVAGKPSPAKPTTARKAKPKPTTAADAAADAAAKDAAKREAAERVASLAAEREAATV